MKLASGISFLNGYVNPRLSAGRIIQYGYGHVLIQPVRALDGYGYASDSTQISRVPAVIRGSGRIQTGRIWFRGMLSVILPGWIWFNCIFNRLRSGRLTVSHSSDPLESFVSQEQNDLPILIPFSLRNKEQVLQSITEATASARNREFAHLLHAAFHKNTPGNP